MSIVKKSAVRVWVSRSLPFVFLLTLFSCGRETSGDPESGISQASYSLGYTIGTSIREQFPSGIDTANFLRGAEDAILGTDAVISEKEMQNSLSFLTENRRQTMEAMAEENAYRGAEFLKENAERPEVIVTASGLQYEVIVEGEGKQPGVNDQVTTHYHGTLVDGTVFDSSLEGDPRTFGVSQVIPGWTEAIQLMAEGSRWRIFLPSGLAYGERGAGIIGPNSTLIFDIELIEVISD